MSKDDILPIKRSNQVKFGGSSTWEVQLNLYLAALY